MKILPDVALTYDDVLLVPQYSDVPSRRKLSTQTKLTRKIVSASADCLRQYGYRDRKCNGDYHGARRRDWNHPSLHDD